VELHHQRRKYHRHVEGGARKLKALGPRWRDKVNGRENDVRSKVETNGAADIGGAGEEEQALGFYVCASRDGFFSG